ncbi:N-acetyltransferase domain-containing protein [Mycena venus]|uniref:N-acetyltransferase domain-containing protein n=1 Tax=Mycena venus TaxID=2733690 RepID=A0A8H6XP50_9AGAR|nr:N-acetyltransferase domain-containing protein [Mycena venus]
MSSTTTSPFRVRKVKPPPALGPGVPETPELTEMVDTLTKAFSNDAFTAIVTGHQPHNPDIAHARLLCKTTLTAGLLGGDVYIAETTNIPAKIVGCAIWFAPGRALYDSDDQKELALQPLLDSLSEDLQRWWDHFLAKYMKFTAAAVGETQELKSWRLQTIAVLPEYQRQHIGTLLVDTIVSKAALTKTPLCVDCSEEINVKVYQRLGFELMPKEKAGDLKTCREEFTGMHGDAFFVWILCRPT